MARHLILKSWHYIVGVIAAAAGLVAIVLFSDCDVCEAANQILLQGTVAQNCTVNVTADPNASNLPLTTTGAQRVQVGVVNQSCNKKVGYTLDVTSETCAAAPAGAKVVDAVSAELLSYSAEFANPTTGGSTASVTGLLASACGGQTGRNVTNAKISNEDSTVFVNFTGSPTLGAGTYQDTLTVTMNVK